MKPATSPLKNAAAAPFIYFDGAPSMGTQSGGIVEIELASRALMPSTSDQVYADMVCVAHLRCSVNAAMNLRDAITHALQMMEQGNTPKQ